MESFSLTIQRAPHGGYIAWCIINGQAATDPPLPHAARSTLQELVQMMALPMMEKHFNERAVIHAGAAVLPPVEDDAIRLPNVATGPDRSRGYQNGNGLMDRLRSASITFLPAGLVIAPFLALASST